MLSKKFIHDSISQSNYSPPSSAPSGHLLPSGEGYAAYVPSPLGRPFAELSAPGAAEPLMRGPEWGVRPGQLRYNNDYAGVVQLVERLVANEKVVGSNPIARSI